MLKRLDKGEEYREKISDMLRYNVLTVVQVCDLTGMSTGTVFNKFKTVRREGDDLITELDYCHPYEGLENTGPKFVVRNEKLEKILRNGKKR